MFFSLIGFNLSPTDPCLFISAAPNWPCYVHVYVDNMVIIAFFKALISIKYAMEDLGQASSLLGMKLTHSECFITLSQNSYAKKLLQGFNLANGCTLVTPMVPGTCLSAETKAERKDFLSLNINYCHAIGSVNDLAVATQPNIAFAVSQLSQHLENPGIVHWKEFIHLLCSILGTQDYSITIGDTTPIPQVFANANYANCVDSC